MFHPIFYRPRSLGNSGWQQATSNWHSTHSTRGKRRRQSAAVFPSFHSNQTYEHLKKFELGCDRNGCDRKGRGRQCRQSGHGCCSAGRGPRPAAAAVPAAVRTRMHRPRPQCRQSGLGCRPLEAPPPFPSSLHAVRTPQCRPRAAAGSAGSLDSDAGSRFFFAEAVSLS